MASEPVFVADDARLAALLFAVDPIGLGGVELVARYGPARQRWLDLVHCCLGERQSRMLACHSSVESLAGGLDLQATLTSGRRCYQPGLIERSAGGVLIAGSAERLEPENAALLAAALDERRLGLIALNEAVEEGEGLDPRLADRLAVRIDLNTLTLAECEWAAPSADQIREAAARLGDVLVSDEALSALVGLALSLGVEGQRFDHAAMQVARAAAALEDACRVEERHLAVAARLVLLPRATRLPAPPEDDAEPPPPEPEASEPQENQADERDENEPIDQEMAEKLLEAIAATLPPDLLTKLREVGPRLPSRAGGRKASQRGEARRGRPVGSRAGDPRRGQSLDVLETLRTAAPWQRLRGRVAQDAPLIIRAEDFRIRRFKQAALTTTVFIVDASGSAALNRLAEAKGAVELLLGESYVRRDEVALVAFRGTGAELLLPATRSLTRAKRALGELPGGGGTPLAAGLELGLQVALQARRDGQRPVIALLTDGSGNVTLAGQGGRAQAQADAIAQAQQMRALGLSTLLIDIAPRASAKARDLAIAMDAEYVPLPSADSASMAQAIRLTLDRPDKAA